MLAVYFCVGVFIIIFYLDETLPSLSKHVHIKLTVKGKSEVFRCLMLQGVDSVGALCCVINEHTTTKCRRTPLFVDVCA